MTEQGSTVSTVHFSTCLLAAALAFHGLAAAQQTSVQGAAPVAAEPLDLRNLSTPLAGAGKEYRVGPNDLIDVEVFDLDNLKRTVRVNAAGAISLPLIGAVTVAGLTSQEAEARIADRYREKYLQNPQVSVFIKEFTTERITVEGAVVKPGIFPLSGQITLLRALAMAGGFGPIADSSQVMLFRVNEQRQREVAVYDVAKIRSGKSDDPVIRGDDLIVVQQDSTRKLLKDSVFRDIIDSVNPFSVFSR
jgi:polysaccharide export outer membrane protein